MGVIAVLFGSVRFGIAALLGVGIPLSIFGRAIAKGRIKETWTKRPLCIATIATLVLALEFAILVYARAIDSITWSAVVGAGLWSAVIASCSRTENRWFSIGPVVFLILVLYCLVQPFVRGFSSTGDLIQDIRGGRRGIEFFSLSFGWSGPNTRFLEQRLGRMEPEWRHQLALWAARDGNERVNSRSLIYDSDLRDILRKLPNQEAQDQVLRCLTDPKNFMRVHQGLLLTCVYVLDYPPGYDKESWWRHHEVLFRPEHDPKAAMENMWGWIEVTESFAPGHKPSGSPCEQFLPITRQRRAADYQIRGDWGGDHELAKQYARDIAYTGPIYTGY